MKRTLAWCMLLLPLLAGCTRSDRVLSEALRRRLGEHGLVTVQVDDDELLCAVSHPEGTEWFLTAGPVLANRKLGANLSAMGEVVAMERSRDGHRLAVVSVGEGHPVLEVVDLPCLLKSGSYRAMHEIDPYPGGVTIEGWEEGRLVLRCDMLLTRRGENGRVPSFLELDPAARFALCAATGEVVALSRHAREPVPYYRRRLRSRFADVRAMAALALRDLGDRKALADLRRALEAERDDHVRTDMQMAIDGLKK